MRKDLVKIISCVLISLLFLLSMSLGANAWLWLQNSDLHSQIDNMQPINITPPKIIGEVNGSALRNQLTEELNLSRGGKIYLSDGKYQLTSAEEMRRFLKLDLTDQLVYREQEFDCDDFALRLAGQLEIAASENQSGWSSIAFGEIWADNHAYNLFVTKENGELVLYGIEPQNDGIWKIEQPVANVTLVKF